VNKLDEDILFFKQPEKDVNEKTKNINIEDKTIIYNYSQFDDVVDKCFNLFYQSTNDEELQSYYLENIDKMKNRIKDGIDFVNSTTMEFTFDLLKTELISDDEETNNESDSDNDCSSGNIRKRYIYEYNGNDEY